MAAGDIEIARAAAQALQYAGHKMTIFSNKEEQLVKDQIFSLPLKIHARSDPCGRG
jgi:hypothetical protein